MQLFVDARIESRRGPIRRAATIAVTPYSAASVTAVVEREETVRCQHQTLGDACGMRLFQGVSAEPMRFICPARRPNLRPPHRHVAFDFTCLTIAGEIQVLHLLRGGLRLRHARYPPSAFVATSRSRSRPPLTLTYCLGSTAPSPQLDFRRAAGSFRHVGTSRAPESEFRGHDDFEGRIGFIARRTPSSPCGSWPRYRRIDTLSAS